MITIYSYFRANHQFLYSVDTNSETHYATLSELVRYILPLHHDIYFISDRLSDKHIEEIGCLIYLERLFWKNES